MTCYILCWEFGVHNIRVETNKTDFHRVIDDLSNEFVIYKTFRHLQNDYVFYYIENYYGEIHMIGFSCKENEVNYE